MWALQSVILGAKVGLAIASCILTVRLALRLVSVVGAFAITAFVSVFSSLLINLPQQRKWLSSRPELR